MKQNEFWEEKWTRHCQKLPTNRFAKRVYQKIKPHHKTLLDIGSGNGVDTLFFAKQDLEVTAADFSKRALKQLKDRVKKSNLKNITIIQKDTLKLDFKDNSFDIIYAHLSLHYFDDKTTRSIFKKLHSMLKKEGLIFIKCKSIDDALFNKGELIEKNMYTLNGHIRHFFDKKYMKNLLEDFSEVNVRKSSSKYVNYKSCFIEGIAKK